MVGRQPVHSMPPEQNSAQFLDAVENHAGRKFQFRREVEFLIDSTGSPSASHSFEEIIFLAKFITNASNVLKRTGQSREETEKLSAEFKEKIGSVSALLAGLIGRASGDEQSSIVSRFLSPSFDSLNELLALLAELSWIKNYHLDNPDEGE